MNELFAPPGERWQPVSPALARLRRTLLAVVAGVVLVVGAILAAVLAVPRGPVVAGLVVLVAAAAWAWVVIGRSARSWGYAEREEDLYIRHGVMFRRMVAVPYGRMQFVDVTAGPLDQLYGVAAVHLHTASPGTSARIPGLPADEAARLRDRLTSLGKAQAAGL